MVELTEVEKHDKAEYDKLAAVNVDILDIFRLRV